MAVASLITEARALRAETLPREIIRRYDEMQQLATALEPAVEGDNPETTLFYGPSGAGKTAVARRGVQKLQSEALDIQSAYVEGWDRTSAAVLRRVVDEVSRAPVQDNAGRDVLIDRLREHDRHVIVILDELDQLADFGVIHDLYAERGVTLLGICNRLEPLYHRLDSRVESRIRAAVEVRFSKYTHTELVAILRDRADWGLAPDTITNETISYIARRADGDARRAISILRHAAQEATNSGTAEISVATVDAVLEPAERDVRELSLGKLSTDHRRLYEAVRGEGEVTVQELYSLYRDNAPEAVSDRFIRDLRSRLIGYNLLEKLGTKSNRRYRALEP